MKVIVNIIENIGIFIFMGIFLFIVCKNLNKKIIIIVIIFVSLVFELI